ncbi:hypothetical protein JCGZ_13627 [Jatropha curcas]|uniref:Uncharacterized protein n=1 Tax=Jatropha curcas TaxID=180498 RepID=A0A067K9X0_JATCU|nr:hypothetical protein JCGZ_13627 [Jatropha curcas]
MRDSLIFSPCTSSSGAIGPVSANCTLLFDFPTKSRCSVDIRRREGTQSTPSHLQKFPSINSEDGAREVEVLVKAASNGMIVANFWPVLTFPATVYDGHRAILRRGTKRHNLPLLACILESSPDFRSSWNEVGHHGFVRAVYEIVGRMGDRRPRVQLMI